MSGAIDVVASWLGITGRRQAEQEWRNGAAAAQPGEVWTATAVMRDSRRREAISWISGPVDVVTSRPRQTKSLGRQNLPDQARPLGPGTGLFPPKARSVLRRGDQEMPPRLPAASGADLQGVPAGVKVMVEHRDRAHPRLRLVESGYTGYVRHFDGQVGRHIGEAWVVLENVTGLIQDHGEHLDRLHPRPRTPSGSQTQITAETGLSAEDPR